jgi:hypothetical protein
MKKNQQVKHKYKDNDQRSLENKTLKKKKKIKTMLIVVVVVIDNSSYFVF